MSARNFVIGPFFTTALAIFVVGQSAYANDFVVSTDSTTQNNGNALAANDTITVNSGVTVDVTGAPGTAALFSNDQASEVTATNRGTLLSSGSGAGIELGGPDSLAHNFGGIITTGNDGHGISMQGYGGTVTHSGSIQTSGDTAHGVYAAGTGTNISVTGTIDVTGVGSVGVLFDNSNATFFTNGRITSTNGNALQFNGGEAFVTIDAPAFFEGGLVLANSAFGVFNLGASQSNYWVFTGDNWFESPLVFGDVPYVLLGNTISTVDPTQFVAAYASQAQVGTGIGSILNGRLIPFNLANGTSGGVAVSTKGSPLIEPPVEPVKERNVWVQGTGVLSSQSGGGSLLPYQLGFGALAVGADRALSNDVLLGFFGGANASLYNTAAAFSISQKINGKGGFFGIYGTKNIGRGYLNFSLLAGARQLSSRRYINNPGVAGGIDIATATYSSQYFSPSLALGRAYQVAQNLIVTPSVHLSHTTAQIDGYTEIGSAAAITIAGRTVRLFEGRAQLQGQRQFGKTSVIGTLGILNRNSLGGDTITGTLLAAPITYATGTTSDVLAGYASIGLKRQFGRRLSGAISAETAFGQGGSLSSKAEASLKFEF